MVNADNEKLEENREFVVLWIFLFRVKILESEKMENYLEFFWELKKRWNLQVTVIGNRVGGLETVSKSLEKNYWNSKSEESKPFWPQHYWDESWRSEEICCHSDPSERLLANTSGKNTHKNVINGQWKQSYQ